MEIFDNITKVVRDDLKEKIKPGTHEAYFQETEPDQSGRCHILFVLQYEDKSKAVIWYKEAAASGSTAFKVNKYYQTEWMPEEELPLKLEGLSIDAVYENFVRQIAGDALIQGEAGETLKDSVQRDEDIQALKKQIEKLQTRIRKEKQLNVQMKVNAELKAIKKKLGDIING